MLDNVIGWVKKLTEVGVSIIALAVVVQIIFGSQAAFLPGDVIARLTDIIMGPVSYTHLTLPTSDLV